MADFVVGQKVLYEFKARERVGLPNPVEAMVKKVIEGEWISQPLYVISLPSGGTATVRGDKLRVA